MRLAGAVVAAACASCTGGTPNFEYPWDHRGVLCSAGLDDYDHEPPWDRIADGLDAAAVNGWVAIAHTHAPGKNVSIATLERVLDMAEERALPFVTFRELETSEPHAGFALAFDDNAVASWLSVRDLLAARGAHVTFFVSRWTLLSDEDRDDVRLLASDGHDLQPHSINHLHATEYVAEHGLDAYMNDEVLPSFEALDAEGYPPTTFAYPFGDHDDAIDEAILAHVAHVRTTLGTCPY